MVQGPWGALTVLLPLTPEAAVFCQLLELANEQFPHPISKSSPEQKLA